MFGSQILEVAIGVIFVFILISIVCTVIREGIEAWLKTRAAFLEHGIRELLHDKEAKGLAQSLYTHPLIYGLYSDVYKPVPGTKRPSAMTNGGTLPSYIPTKNFALALMDIAARGPATDAVSSDAQSPRISLDSIRGNIANLQNPAVQRIVLTALDAAQGDLNKAQAYIEAWYDSGMDRVSGWYKRSSQWVIFWIALVVAIVLNVNTITIANYLSHNDVARAALVARAGVAVKDPNFTNGNYQTVQAELNALQIPIGWGPQQHYQTQPGELGIWSYVFGPLLGWLLTALAAMLGAPFWFDVLNKIMVIRSTVKPHEKSKEEASEDRQESKSALIPSTNGVDGTQHKAQLSENMAVVASLAQQPLATPRDEESGLDGCEVVAINLTLDEHLPAAEGGVA
ncbi:hypothetical protein [Hymenobacter canadensis]|uniref:Uncharacterized protein n=1 Tax=Hymenobacter canadensis TaxID=2999067 RepID=A0ABY7LY06_9BACT|nr:hypothetical protein [Hymenobacter canadensis]WBA44287.1 hypothetical protein O3303_21670 [Hymenobacter canadensis]